MMSIGKKRISMDGMIKKAHDVLLRFTSSGNTDLISQRSGDNKIPQHVMIPLSSIDRILIIVAGALRI